MHVLGAVSDGRINTLYGESDVFVLASRFEGYGMAYAEALAHGLPVIGTTGGATPETVPRDAGILVAPDDVTALAGALRLVISSKAERERMASAAWTAAAALPTWQEFRQAVRRRHRGCGMSGFSADWLALREPHDRRARNVEVLDAVVTAFASHISLNVADIGCGTGSTYRVLSPRLPSTQRWRLYDNDLSLLARAAGPANVTTLPLDLSRDLEAALDGAVDLVTTSALLDLVSGPLAGTVRHRGRGATSVGLRCAELRRPCQARPGR